MRLPTATLLTACALSAAFLVAGRGGAGEGITRPDADTVLPAAEGRVVSGDPFGALFADSDRAGPGHGSLPGSAAGGSGRGVTGSAIAARTAAEAGPVALPEPDEAPGPQDGQDTDEGAGSDLDRGIDPNEIGPATVPEVPDLPDGGGLVPDGPDESDTPAPSGSVIGGPVDVLPG
ncbi:hypothetical protein AB0G76_23275 [Streptomyces asoensis]|uniref:hypothetical protein n=1 Tax=Streptomyces asoensis TaxID=249586 RepID=UPI0033F4B701